MLLMSKVQMLERQFADRGVHIIGIQEGRAKASHERMGTEYKMLTAAADPKGDFGVQLWVLHGITVLAWRAVSPRLLYAVTSHKGAEQGWLVGHAPIEHAKTKDKDAWWDLLEDTYQASCTKFKVPWSCLLDANAKVGVMSPSAPRPRRAG